MKKKMHKEGKCNCKSHGTCGSGYFLGFIGAAVYNISTAATVGAGFVGFFKALVWPAFIVFELMKFLAM